MAMGYKDLLQKETWTWKICFVSDFYYLWCIDSWYHSIDLNKYIDMNYRLDCRHHYLNMAMGYKHLLQKENMDLENLLLFQIFITCGVLTVGTIVWI
jgi:hypothetical protein